jgi:hypothetical protein
MAMSAVRGSALPAFDPLLAPRFLRDPQAAIPDRDLSAFHCRNSAVKALAPHAAHTAAPRC